MKLGIYIGSFNPVHNGHIQIVNKLLNNKIVDKMLIVPTGNYWDKKDLINIEDRINMFKIFETKNIIIEEKYNNIPYTYELMRQLKVKYKDYDLYLIIGADNIINFDKWKNYKELLSLNLIIIGRNNIDIKYYLNLLNKKDKYTIVDSDINISSTNIRNNIRESYKYVDNRVFEYIIKNNIYSK